MDSKIKIGLGITGENLNEKYIYSSSVCGRYKIKDGDIILICSDETTNHDIDPTTDICGKCGIDLRRIIKAFISSTD